MVPDKLSGQPEKEQRAMQADPKKSVLADQIDENLKRVYDALLNEQLPNRFRLLLEQLKEKERGK